MYNNVIALTGNSGSGKSEALRIFKKLGAQIESADDICRILLKNDLKTQSELIQAFGKSIIEESKDDTSIALKTSALREILHSNPKAKETIESILHPKIKAEAENRFQAIHDKFPDAIIVYEIPLLFEKYTSNGPFPLSILICAHEELLLKRLTKRDSLSTEVIQKRLALQMPQDKKRELADITIENNSSQLEFEKKLKHSWKEEIIPALQHKQNAQ